MKGKIKLRNALRHRLIMAGLLFIIAGSVLFLSFFLGNNKTITGAPANGDIRSVASGNWSTLAIWQKYNGSAWIPATSVPSNGDNVITIQSGHTVTITAALSVDQVTVEAGAVLALNSGITLTLKKAAIPDLNVYGIFRNAGIVSIAGGTMITYYSGGAYQHNYTTTPGTIPIGVWNTGSTCEIIGYTTNTGIPVGLNQSFSDFKWNCPSQSVDVNFAGGLTSFTGNFIVNSTGAGTNQLILSSNNLTLALTGSLIVNGGILNINSGTIKTSTLNQTGNISVTGGLLKFNSGVTNTGTINLTGNYSQTGGTFDFATGATSNSIMNVSGNLTMAGGIFNLNTGATNTGTINLTGNYSQTSGTFIFATGATTNGTMNVTGDYSLTGGTTDFASGSVTSGTLNILGNFTHTGGTLMSSNILGSGKVIFKKAGSQTFTSSGNTVTGAVDYTVNSGSTLNMGTSAMLGRNFTLSSGGELGIGSPDGITSSGAVGNIRVSGTRSYNTGAYYLYNGTFDQYTGNGLPATINKLTISNGNFLKLTNSVAVSNNLNFISGKIYPESNELQVTSTSATAITGASATSYVAGNLRRTITGTGTFDFPVGGVIKYELLNVTTNGLIGPTSLLATSYNASTNDTANLLNVTVNGVPIVEMLDYGYWTLTPNIAPTGGNYTLTLMETGFSNMLSNGTIYSLLMRDNSSSPWASIGTQNDALQTASGGTVTAVRSGLTSFNYQFGIGLGDFPSFTTNSLIAGTAGQPGAIYLFQDVMRNVDAWISITRLYNGATLSDIDNGTTGYAASFQPFVNFPAGKESYIEWAVTFKVANTNKDTVMKKITATGVDVDGTYNSATDYLQEYVVATMPTSYSLDPATLITMSNDSGRYKAVGPTLTINNIDTAHHEVMYQNNYNNVNTILYRTGAINMTTSTQTRQTSLFFRSFLVGSPIYALPIELVNFTANLRNEKVNLNWVTATEVNNDYFTIERSQDGTNFKTLFTKKGAGNSTTRKNYEMIDPNPLPGYSYYRLKQTDFSGKFSYSRIEAINNSRSALTNALQIESVSPNPFDSYFEVAFSSKANSTAILTIMNSEGRIIKNEKVNVGEGNNTYRFEDDINLKPGIYFVIIDQGDQRVTKKVLKK